MLRIFPKPGLLSGLVVAASVASGLAFGSAVMLAALGARAAMMRTRR